MNASGETFLHFSFHSSEGLKAGERGPQELACFPKWKTPRFSFLLPADALWLSEPQILSLRF